MTETALADVLMAMRRDAWHWVDLYDLPGRIVFGELSSFPAGGDSPFYPESYNTQFGEHWTPPRRYR